MSICRRVALCVLFVLSPLVAHADVVLDWNARMFMTITGQSPFGTARLAAITQLAVFEAVNAITKSYEPYLGTIDARDGASAEAAAAAAAHTIALGERQRLGAGEHGAERCGRDRVRHEVSLQPVAHRDGH